MKKFRVVYEIGEPDFGVVTTHVAETMATSERKAISNVWYRTGRNNSFRAVKVVLVNA